MEKRKRKLVMTVDEQKEQAPRKYTKQNNAFGYCGWDVLPNELVEKIILYTIHKNANDHDDNLFNFIEEHQRAYSFSMFMVCELVCKLWRDLLPFHLLPSNFRKEFIRDAIEEGHLNLLLWARDNGCDNNNNHHSTITNERESGSGSNSSNIWINPSLCAGAAARGHTEVLRWLLEEVGCPCDSSTCSFAARGGHLDTLKWARERERECPWDYFTCSMAAAGGHLDTLKWAREHGCPIDAKDASYEAAACGRLEVLQWLWESECASGESGCCFDEVTAFKAAGGGHLDVLVWLREVVGCQWNAATAAMSAKGGHLHVLKWLLKVSNRGGGHGNLFTSACCYRAAEEGRLDVLIWLREEAGCPWDVHSFSMAAKAGHMHVLRWLKEKGCPCNSDAAAKAALEGRLEVLEWMKKEANGVCPLDTKSIYSMAERKGHMHILQWLKEA